MHDFSLVGDIAIKCLYVIILLETNLLTMQDSCHKSTTPALATVLVLDRY